MVISGRMRLKSILIPLLAAASAWGAGRDFSTAPPGGLAPDQVPQFVSFGFDDNFNAGGVKWALDYLRDKKNPTTAEPNPATYDGADARVSFYVNTKNGAALADIPGLPELFQRALAEGHEIGDHTQTHSTGITTSEATWIKEAKAVWTDLANVAGIKSDTVVGFRSPFLAYNAATFAMLDSLHFRYDCSIETGFQDSVDGTNFFWPYTLDKGPSDLVTPTGNHPGVGRHPGLWEVPVACVIVPKALRHRIWSRNHAFDTASGKITGFDYNVFTARAGNGMELRPGEYLATLKYNLDQRLAGNRAPFCFGAHTQLYDKAQYKPIGDDTLPPGVTPDSLKAAVQAFIDYALSKPQVRIVPFREIVRWCEKPVALSGTTAVHAASKPGSRGAAGRGIVWVTGDAPKRADLYSIDGRAAASATAAAGRLAVRKRVDQAGKN